jgi:hypothetical protein
LTEALNLVGPIGLAALVALVISLIGIGASIEDACRNWPEKATDRHWRRITITRNLALIFGVVLSAFLTGSTILRNASLQRQLAKTREIAQAAQGGVDSASAAIVRPRDRTRVLASESSEALAESEAENRRAILIGMQVAQVDSDTKKRLAIADRLAKQADAAPVIRAI